MNGENRLLVETDALRIESDIVNRSIHNVSRSFEEFGNIVNSVSRYWEGEGAEAHKNAYRQKADRIDEVRNRFQEHVIELQQMAGIYENAERMNESEANALPSDAIV